MKSVIEVQDVGFDTFWLLGDESVIDEIINGFKALKQALDNKEISYTQFQDTIYKIKNEYDVEVIVLKEHYQIIL